MHVRTQITGKTKLTDRQYMLTYVREWRKKERKERKERKEKKRKERKEKEINVAAGLRWPTSALERVERLHRCWVPWCATRNENTSGCFGNWRRKPIDPKSPRQFCLHRIMMTRFPIENYRFNRFFSMWWSHHSSTMVLRDHFWGATGTERPKSLLIDSTDFWGAKKK